MQVYFFVVHLSNQEMGGEAKKQKNPKQPTLLLSCLSTDSVLTASNICMDWRPM